MRPLVSVVVPTRRGEPVDLTMNSLMAQSLQDFEAHVVVDHEARGQSWARNRGAALARGRYVLFSDNDIAWAPDALERLVARLEGAPPVDAAGWRVGYAYGPYRFLPSTEGALSHPVEIMGQQEWDWAQLVQANYVSTMSLLRRELFPGFDEALRRLEDWDLWLRLGLSGVRGVYEPGVLFSTRIRPGISFGGQLSHEEAEATVRRKYGLAPETWRLG